MKNKDFDLYVLASGLSFGFSATSILSVLAGYSICQEIHSMLHIGPALVWYGASIVQAAGAAFFGMLAHDIDRRRN